MFTILAENVADQSSLTLTISDQFPTLSIQNQYLINMCGQCLTLISSLGYLIDTTLQHITEINKKAVESETPAVYPIS